MIGVSFLTINLTYYLYIKGRILAIQLLYADSNEFITASFAHEKKKAAVPYDPVILEAAAS